MIQLSSYQNEDISFEKKTLCSNSKIVSAVILLKYYRFVKTPKLKSTCPVVQLTKSCSATNVQKHAEKKI